MKIAAKQYLGFLMIMVIVAAVLSNLPENGIASPLSELAVLVGGAVLFSFGKTEAITQWIIPVTSAATFCLLVGIAQVYALEHDGPKYLGHATDRITMNMGEFPMGADAPWVFSFVVWAISLILLAVGAWILSLLFRRVIERVRTAKQ
jgi:hypothetical protein